VSETEEAQALPARRRTAAAVKGAESGVGIGLRTRCDRSRSCNPSAERGGCVHAGVPGVGVDTSFASRRGTRVLEEILLRRGQPLAIRCDNGPELTSRHFLAWCVERHIELIHIQPGKPTQNAHVESFHGRLQEECLRVSWFQNLFDARKKIGQWRTDYNQQRPHSSLNYLTPEEFAAYRKEDFYRADVGQEASNAGPLPHSPIPAETEGGVNINFRIQECAE
jgi:Integrase core domain